MTTGTVGQESFAAALQRWMDAAGKTTNDLAIEADVDLRTVKRWLQGLNLPPEPTAERCARAVSDWRIGVRREDVRRTVGSSRVAEVCAREPLVAEYLSSIVAAVAASGDWDRLSRAEADLIYAVRRVDEQRPHVPGSETISGEMAAQLTKLLSIGRPSAQVNGQRPGLGRHPPPWPEGETDAAVSDAFVDAIRIAGELPAPWHVGSWARQSREAAAALAGAAGFAFVRGMLQALHPDETDTDG